MNVKWGLKPEDCTSAMALDATSVIRRAWKIHDVRLCKGEGAAYINKLIDERKGG